MIQKFENLAQQLVDQACDIDCSKETYIDGLRAAIDFIEVEITAAEEL